MIVVIVYETQSQDTNYQSVPLDKYIKRVKNTGNLSIFYGWLKIVMSPFAILLTITLDRDHPGLTDKLKLFSYSDVVLNASLGFVFLILGTRIKNIYDKNIHKYLIILLIISSLWLILITMVSGKFGNLLFIYIITIIIGLRSYKILLKETTFMNSLKKYVYKLKTLGWVILGAVSLILLYIAIIFEVLVE